MSEDAEHVGEVTRVGHCKADETDVYIGRGPGGRSMTETKIGNRGWLGNPFTVEEHGREESIRRFRSLLASRVANEPDFREALEGLSGKRLGCWCQRLDEDGPACHGEAIAEYADRLASGESHLEVVKHGF